MMPLTLYYWNTPNGHKPVILLEELGLPYDLLPVNIGRGEQFADGFTAVNPNQRIPALRDDTPQGPATVFESGAILQYLAEHHGGGRFLPADPAGRAAVMSWLFWQVGGLGPMAGQVHHFTRYAPEPVPYARDRYVRETRRLYGVLERTLALPASGAADATPREGVAGAYSIADMAIYPWIVEHAAQQQDLAHTPHLQRWFHAMGERPAVRRAYARAETWLGDSRARFDAEGLKHLFGFDAPGGPPSEATAAPAPVAPPAPFLPVNAEAVARARHAVDALRHAARTPLGEPFRLTQFGVNFTFVPPGAVSALCHWHSLQDEFIYVLEGHPTLHTQRGDAELSPGDGVGFAGGQANGHQLINRTDRMVVLLEVGDRRGGDVATFPENTAEEVDEALGKRARPARSVR